MKQLLLTGLMILFSLQSIFGQMANQPPNLSICNKSGYVEFDLKWMDRVILGSQNTALYEVTYHQSLTDAESDNSPLYTHFNINAGSLPITFYARVEDINTGNFATTFFDVEAISLYLSDFEETICDNDGVFDGIATFDSGNFRYGGLTYYRTLTDANKGLNPLPRYFENTKPNNDLVYARLESNGCYVTARVGLYVNNCSGKGVINVSAFFDENRGGSFESDEEYFLNGIFTYEVNNDGIQHQVDSSTGHFTILSTNKNDKYDISYKLNDEYLTCFKATYNLFENMSVSNTGVINCNFPVTRSNICKDLSLSLISYISPRPGFDYTNRLIIKNETLETISSAIIKFTYNDFVTLNNVSGLGTGNSISNFSNGFNLIVNNLKPNQKVSLLINMSVPISISLGTLLTNKVTYSINDTYKYNNTSTLSEVVIGSYDPNDILESHGSEILHSSFDSEDYLYYTVRFQNVGTADAINVSIDNTLNPKLDKSTIQMLASSHTNVFTRTDDQLNWQFDNIHLPSEDMDETASHGFVYYKIKPLAGYSVGDIIPNTAEIYFDFNPAVVTNTFETEFTTTLSSSQFSNVEFSMFPNPAKNNVALKFKNTIRNTINVSVHDIQGKLILNSQKELKNSTIQLNVSALKSGMYFLKVNDGSHLMTKKMIIE